MHYHDLFGLALLAMAFDLPCVLILVGHPSLGESLKMVGHMKTPDDEHIMFGRSLGTNRKSALWVDLSRDH